MDFAICKTEFYHDCLRWYYAGNNLSFSYLFQNGLYESPVVYLCPSVSKFVSFALWDMCNLKKILLQMVPQNIYNYFRTGNMGIFEKLDSGFKQIVSKRYVTEKIVSKKD